MLNLRSVGVVVVWLTAVEFRFSEFVAKTVNVSSCSPSAYITLCVVVDVSGKESTPEMYSVW